MAAADAQSPVGTALTRAMAQALGADVQVEIRPFTTRPTDVALADEARARGAERVALVVFSDPERTRASLQMTSPASGEFQHQTLIFASDDPPEERGRALGMVLASYLLLVEPRPPPPRAPALTARPTEAPPAREVSPWPRHYALEVSGVTVAGVGGEGGGVGGAAAARWRAGPWWGLRMGAEARSGNLRAAQASTLAVKLVAGPFVQLAGDPDSGHLSLSARVGAMALFQALTHFSDDDAGPVRRGRWLPGGDAVLELSCPLSDASAIHFGLGAEATLGAIDIVVRGHQVGRLSALRGLAELGFRALF